MSGEEIRGAGGAAGPQGAEAGRRAAPTSGRVAFFYTCSVNYNHPEIGRACVEVLEWNGVQVEVPVQRCCGMPFLDCGDLASMEANLRFNLERLLPLVRAGYDVVTPGPSCSLMLKVEYPSFVPGPETRELAAATYDICEYLLKRRAEGRLRTDFARPLGTVAYHHPCHLRAQKMGPKAVQLLRLVPGTRVTMVEACSGHDGTWGMKREFFQLSLRQGEKLFRGLTAAGADRAASDCPLAARQIRQGAGLAAVHPILLLHEAYGLGARGRDAGREEPGR
ncbi:MAG TPA: heterodisulfide reductase-related iron-sulfur binding cluster [Thermodesulfobacteriota bacterium]|nr:heterodisulfide reductase-related iron-sulfur binding cluster [Thermodesulfobacteriota bacterium]